MKAKRSTIPALAAMAAALIMTMATGTSADVRPGADGYITDPRDGARYRTVTIGSLTWMAENMHVNLADFQYNSWCYGDDNANCAKYGRLYTAYAASEICPAGWRLPAIADWDHLFVSIGCSFDEETHSWNAAGARLKSKTGWKDRGNGTDDFGFSALPGGLREGGYSKYGFRLAGDGGYWWAAREDEGSYQVSYRAMGYDLRHVNENRLEADFGLSVRCVRGNAAPPAPGRGRPVLTAPPVNPSMRMPRPDTRWYNAGSSFTISTADQLAGLAELVNGGNEFKGKTITLGAAIDLSAYGKARSCNA